MQTSAERGSGEASTRRPSDRELIARFLASRDESAFAEIVTRYSRLVMSVALHSLRDPHAAEDAFQAAFLVLAKSARRIRNRDSLASWLHGTTFRVSQRLLRTRQRRKEQDLPNVELTAPIWATPERPDEQAALDEELARLSDGLRGPLVLHYLEGRTVPEIAAELKMSQSAVEGRLKRGKRTLRKRLLKRGVLLSSAVFGAGLTIPAEAGVAAGLVTVTVAACLKTAASASLTPIAATMVQQIAVQEMAAMTRIAILKTALVCGGVVGAVGLAGAGANGTLGMAWGQQSGGAAVADGGESRLDAAELPMEPTGLIQTALAQAAGEPAEVLTKTNGTGPRLNLIGRNVLESDIKVINAEGAIKTPSVRAHVEQSLKAPAEIRFRGQTLAEALHFVAAHYKIPVVVERGAMQLAGIDYENDEVFGGVKGLPLEESLQILFASVQGDGLTFRVEDDGLHVGPRAVTVADAAGAGAAATQGESQKTRDQARDALRQKDEVIQKLQEDLRHAQVQFEQLKEQLQKRDQKTADAAAPPGGTPTEALSIAAKQLAAKDEEIRALDNMVRAMQARGNSQPEASPESPNVGKGPLAPIGTSDAGYSGTVTATPGAVPGAAPGAGYGQPGVGSATGTPVASAQTAETKALQEQIEQMRAIIEAQKAASKRRGLGQSETGSGAGSGSSRTGASGHSSGEVQKFQPQSVNREQIAKALEDKVDLQFTGQTLEEVMNFLGAQGNIPIRLDRNALALADVKPNTEISLIISGVSLKSALNLMLEDVGGAALDYVIEDEVMKITTKAKADATMQTVIYDVSGLGSVDANWVASTLEKTVEPQSWEGAGGKGTIVTNDSAVMVTTSRRLHDKTAEIMQMLQQHAKARKANQ